MRVKLLRDSRILHKAGEIIDVSPAEAFYLESTESALRVAEAVKAPETAMAQKPVKRKK